MEIDDFVLMSKGFWDAQKYQERIIKRLAYITHASFVQKPLHPDRLWPEGEVKAMTKEELNERSKRIIKQLALMQKIEDEKRKNS